ncbi:hypothetical protein JTB14_034977 [Gonioctena quinquepunctata]|nr:hypothetical protein JTB14_034977 [Gonioctena quinquepunctata]
MMHPLGPSEVENTAGEGATEHVKRKEEREKKEESLISEGSPPSLNITALEMVASGEESQYSESGTSSASANKGKESVAPGEPRKRQYRRSCRMTAIVDGVAIKHGKRKRWSPEKVEAKTAAWEEGQKKKWNKGACECGGTEGKHTFLVGKEDYRIKRMCRGSIAETVAVCGIELVTKKDSDCIRQALQENEEFESDYTKNAKPNIDEVMEVNPMEGKSKALEPGSLRKRERNWENTKRKEGKAEEK